MKAEEYLKLNISKLFGKNVAELDINYFSYSADMIIKFAESFSQNQNRELIEALETVINSGNQITKNYIKNVLKTHKK